MTNSGMSTLGKIAELVATLSENCRDEMIAVADLTFDNLAAIRIAGQSYPLRVQAQRQLTTRLGIPFNFLKKCDDDLQSHILTRRLETEKNSELFFRFDGPEVRAVFTKKYQPVSDVELIEQVMEMGYSHQTVVQADDMADLEIVEWEEWIDS